jgi:hypothetical protein
MAKGLTQQPNNNYVIAKFEGNGIKLLDDTNLNFYVKQSNFDDLTNNNIQGIDFDSKNRMWLIQSNQSTASLYSDNETNSPFKVVKKIPFTVPLTDLAIDRYTDIKYLLTAAINGPIQLTTPSSSPQGLTILYTFPNFYPNPTAKTNGAVAFDSTCRKLYVVLTDVDNPDGTQPNVITQLYTFYVTKLGLVLPLPPVTNPKKIEISPLFGPILGFAVHPVTGILYCTFCGVPAKVLWATPHIPSEIGTIDPSADTLVFTPIQGLISPIPFTNPPTFLSYGEDPEYLVLMHDLAFRETDACYKNKICNSHLHI